MDTLLDYLNTINCGSLHIFLGPMSSGKSTALIEALKLRADIGMKVLYINHECDKRDTEAGDNIVTTHSSQFKGLSNKIKYQKVTSLSEVNVEPYKVIGIDEFQFFDCKDVEFIKDWVDLKKLTVFIASLDGDFLRNQFGPVFNLIPHADTVTKLNAKCQICLQLLEHEDSPLIKEGILQHNVASAPFTARMGECKEQKLVGGLELYKALCRYHYNQWKQGI